MKENDTRQRILESACALFAEKGFKSVTVAQICADAEANIAAVNYHFQSKEELYREVWRNAHSISEKKYPSELMPETDPYTCLRETIRNRILCIFDEGPAGCFPRIINREMTTPSPIAEQLFSEFLHPRREAQQALIRRLLGPAATEQQVRICAVNVLSVYAFINIARKPREHMFGRKKPTSKQLKDLISQTQEFVCSAIRGVQASIEGQSNR